MAEQPLPDLPVLAQHAVHLFYELHFDEGRIEKALSPTASSRGRRAALDATFGGLVQGTAAGAAPWVPADIRPALAGRYAGDALWQPAQLQVGDDLLPQLRQLLASKDGSLAAGLALTPNARRLLARGDLYAEDTPREARITKRLALELGPRAQRRIEARTGEENARDPLLILDDLVVVIFRTGLGVAWVKIHVDRVDRQPLHPVWLIEALAALARFDVLRWETAQGAFADEQQCFSLGAIVRTLVAGAGSDAHASPRVFTLTFSAFAPPPAAAARRLAVQLARRYTDDYALVDMPGRVELVQDFANVQHAAALEGAATVIDLAPRHGLEPGPFLETFQTGTFERHYVPLGLLAVHERAFVSDVARQASFWPAGDGADAELGLLERVQERSLCFRLSFRFAEVSRISMHNAFHLALRRAMNLDRIERELADDIAEISGHLRSESDKRRALATARAERRFRWATIVGAAGLGWLTTYTIFKEALKALHAVPDDLGGLIRGDPRGRRRPRRRLGHMRAGLWRPWRLPFGRSCPPRAHDQGRPQGLSGAPGYG